MEPGRKLDALIAEHVMGLERITSLFLEIGWRPKGVPVGVHQLKPYSTDIAAAWEVVNKVDFLYLWKNPYTGKFECKLTVKDEDKYYVREIDTAPHAICLAALKTVGVGLDEIK